MSFGPRPDGEAAGERPFATPRGPVPTPAAAARLAGAVERPAGAGRTVIGTLTVTALEGAVGLDGHEVPVARELGTVLAVTDGL